MNLFEKFSIEPNNKDYYKMAFTHGSYATVHGLKYDYERLEFLGDSILNMLVSEYLYKKYPKYGEGKLTKLRANFVCQSALIQYSHELGLKDYLKVSVDEMKLTDNEVVSITSDLFESFLGALFLDQGLAFTKRFVAKIIFRYIDEEKIFFYDYKSSIKEFCDAQETKIHYELLEEHGVPHDKTFVMAIYLDDIKMGEGIGKNKKEAEQAAAKIAMKNLHLIR
ncbi:ribonuclease III [Methanobrevibacter millerae]|uniref:ribonuclease III n=1 Tax=Methanobrevibacter millerae TaxID=230361 RepID=A0A1G5V593_9EURY|nr:ribonuclease III [Methanobrevibacter millerae]SDA40427.1 ribonuclease-3 [Methanobrevibacter millerae]